MLSCRFRNALFGVAALAVSGCTIDTFSYTIERYGTRTATHVHLGCRDTYEVFDRPDAGTLLVVTGALNEALTEMCGGGVAALGKAERMRRAAAIFLHETTDRPLCQIVREADLTGNHTEFGYRCPAPRPTVSR